MAEITQLLEQLRGHFGEHIAAHNIHCDELTIDVPSEKIREICYVLRDDAAFNFDILIDVCGIDYQVYGLDEWKTQSATLSGFSRGVMSSMAPTSIAELKPKNRFAVAYHLLSIKHNHRLRLKTYLSEDNLLIDSVISVWASANWYEREAFDLYGILFKDHPDLRRILTDYGFIGHPFRKDFPISGHVEMRYDATAERCIYDPVTVVPRTLVPKVIREDHRYLISEIEEGIPNG